MTGTSGRIFGGAPSGRRAIVNGESVSLGRSRGTGVPPLRLAVSSVIGAWTMTDPGGSDADLPARCARRAHRIARTAGSFF